MSKIILALLGLWVVVAHLVIAASYAISRFSGGIALVFIALWVAILGFSFAGIVESQEELDKWWSDRKAKKAEPQSPPKGDWKG